VGSGTARIASKTLLPFQQPSNHNAWLKSGRRGRKTSRSNHRLKSLTIAFIVHNEGSKPRQSKTAMKDTCILGPRCTTTKPEENGQFERQRNGEFLGVCPFAGRARLRTVPWVGPITALTWALEIGDVSRFRVIRAATHCTQISRPGGRSRGLGVGLSQPRIGLCPERRCYLQRKNVIRGCISTRRLQSFLNRQ